VHIGAEALLNAVRTNRDSRGRDLRMMMATVAWRALWPHSRL